MRWYPDYENNRDRGQEHINAFLSWYSLHLTTKNTEIINYTFKPTEPKL